MTLVDVKLVENNLVDLYTLLCCFAHLLDLMNVNLIVNARITLSTQYT